MSTTEADPTEATTEEPTIPADDPETGDAKETETGDDPAPEEAPQEPPAESTQADFEQAQKQLGRSATTWRNAVSRIMGEDAQHLEPCPLCPDNLPGFIFPDAIPPDHRAQVIAWLRGADVPEMQTDPDTKVCDICNGHGLTLTGSNVPGNDTKPCAKCNAKGWTNKDERETWRMMHPDPNAPQPPAAPSYPVTTASPGFPTLDPWGRPQGQEFYGRDPVYMTPEEQARDPWSPTPQT